CLVARRFLGILLLMPPGLILLLPGRVLRTPGLQRFGIRRRRLGHEGGCRRRTPRAGIPRSALRIDGGSRRADRSGETGSLSLGSRWRRVTPRSAARSPHDQDEQDADQRQPDDEQEDAEA